ncbi:helix-turn-helix domain-containing protein [Micromonospora sp. B11E3]|uniref:PucR family transcriptional regulator n=1 Tax=Micromonospora sp. B11E3 TaxID=3153562 RepID=UPI00325D8485
MAETTDRWSFYREWIEAQGDVVFERLVDLLTERVPRMVPDDVDRALLRASVMSHLPSFRSFGLVARPQRWAIPKPARALVIAQADSGAPLESLLMAYEIGKVEIWKAFLEAVRAKSHEALPADFRLALLEVVMSWTSDYVQDITAQVVEIYSTRTAHLSNREGARVRETLDNFIAGDIDVAHAEELLGYSIASCAHVAFVVATAPDLPAGRLDAAVSHVASMLGGPFLAMALGARSALVWVTVREGSWTAFGSRLPSRPPEGAMVALSSEQYGAVGFRRVREEALSAAPLLEANPSASPLCFPDVEAETLALQDHQAARRLVHRQLGALLHQWPAGLDLIQTVQVFLETGASPTRTARQLHLHPNTVTQRLKKFEKVRGRPTEVGDLPLWLALRLAPMVRLDHAADDF